MRKFYKAIGIFALAVSSLFVNSQVNLTQNFNAGGTPAGWTVSNFAQNTTLPCEGAGSMRRNFWSSGTTGSLTSPTQTATGYDIDVSFTYKIIDYDAPNPATMGNWGTMNVQYSIDGGTNWITHHTINELNHTPSTTCTLVNLIITNVDVPNGSNFRVRFSGTWISGDYFFYIDEFSMFEQVPCPGVINVTASNIAANSADVSWTSGATSFNIEWSTSPFTPGMGEELGSDVVATTTHPLSGLTPQTTYYVYVQVDCGIDGLSTWSGPLVFTTPCAPGSIPFFEGFESGYTHNTNLAGCWSQQSLSGTTSWVTNNILTDYNRTPRTGGWNSFLRWDNNDWMFYPLELIGGTNYQLDFWVRQDATSGTTVSASYGINGDAASMINEIVPATAVTNGAYQLMSGFFTPPSNGVYYIGIRGQLNFTPYYISIDDISVIETPSCLNPISLTALNITGNSAELSWTENGTASLWNVEWDAGSFVQGTGANIETGVTNPFDLTGLQPLTTYSYYVQADCGLGDESPWAGPFSFTTSQVPVSSFPWTEDFETGGTDWSIVNGTQVNQWHVGSAVNNGGSSSIYVSNDAGVSNAYTITSTSRVHAYRDIEFPASAYEMTLSFDWISVGETIAWDKMRVFLVPTSFVPAAGTAITTTGTAPTGRIQLGQVNYNNQNTWTTASIVIPNAYINGSARLVFEWTNDGGGGTQPPAAVDNISILVSNCPPVSDLAATNITIDGADLSWTSGDSETLWNIEYGPAGFTPGDGTTITGTTDNPYSLTGLDEDTEYGFYVQADCGGEESAWVGPFTFTTLAGCPIVTDVTIDNLTATSFDISWTAGGIETDWILEYGEAGFTIGDGTIENITGTPEFSMIGLDPETGYEFYITADCGATQSVTVGPISVTTPPTCPAPTAVIISDIESDEATISWTSNGSETQWNIEYGPAGFTPGTGTVLNVPSFPVTISGLDPITEYDVYVQADCGAGDESSWTSVQSFTTLGSCGNFTLSLTDSFGDGWNGGFLNVYVNGVLTISNLTLPSGYGPLNVNIPMNINDILSVTYTAGSWSDENEYTVSNELGTIVATQGAGFSIPGNIGNPAVPSGIQACPTCPAPSAVIISNISQESADVTWTPNGVETEWAIEYGPSGFTPGTGMLEDNITSIPHSLTGLDNSTTYDVYVWAVCDIDDNSSLVGPISFTTNYGCGGTFSDNGGPSGDYAPNSNDIYTICADNVGDYVQVTFTSFQTEATWDGIYVFDGDDITAPMIASANPTGNGPMTQPGAYWGSTIPGPFVSTNPEGCLTINFLSDGSVQQAGFVAIIECFPCTPNAGVDGAVDVCRLDGTLDLGTVITEGEDFGVWTFTANPSLLSGSMLNIASLPGGTYSAEYIVTTACDADTTIATVNVYGPSSAGNNGTVQTCNFGPLNLFDGLTGTVDLGGTWYDPAGNPITGTMVNFNGQIPANYNYYYITSNNVCPADTAFVEVQLINCASISENELSGFALYPNPTSDVIYIQYSGTSMTANMVLVDTKGSIVYNEKVNFATEDNYEIDLSKLVKGVYFLNIYSEEGSKVIKVVRN